MALIKKNNMDSKKTVLVSGGAGYIGSHTAVELLNAGYNVAIKPLSEGFLINISSTVLFTLPHIKPSENLWLNH